MFLARIKITLSRLFLDDQNFFSPFLFDKSLEMIRKDFNFQQQNSEKLIFHWPECNDFR